jgi:hypothetical protein
MGMGGERHAPAALPLGKTRCIIKIIITTTIQGYVKYFNFKGSYFSTEWWFFVYYLYVLPVPRNLLSVARVPR